MSDQDIRKNFEQARRQIAHKHFVNKPLVEMTDEEINYVPPDIAAARKHMRGRITDEKKKARMRLVEKRITAMRRNSANIKGLAINVRTWAEGDTQTYACWGDWHVKMRLEAAFRELGHTCEVFPELADITLYLWGSPFRPKKTYPFYYNERSFNVAWFYSHPEKMTPDELRTFDLAFCLSPSYINAIRDWGVPTEVLMGCTDMRPPERPITTHDIVFIGNARGALAHGRDIIRDLKPPQGTKVLVFGHKWQSKPDFPRAWYGGRYFAYDRLPELYAGSKICLNDHHREMAKNGFIAVKIFDILASGGFCISDYVQGMDRFFRGAVPMFRTGGELNEKVRFYLEHPEERAKLAEKGRAIAQKHTYRSRAEKIIEVARQHMGA